MKRLTLGLGLYCSRTFKALALYVFAMTSTISAFAQMSGNYTINPSGGDFATYSDAISALQSQGVNGAVTIRVTSTAVTYRERLRIPPITGASATNTITFKGNLQPVVGGSTLSGERAAIALQAADFIILDSIRVQFGDSTYGWGIHVASGSDNNIIRHCLLEGNITATTSNFIGIAFAGSTTVFSSGGTYNGNIVENNTVVGGYANITSRGFAGGSGNYLNVFRNNVLRDAYNYGIYLYDHDSTIVRGNEITCSGRTPTSYFGIYLTGSNPDSRRVLIEGNRIHDIFPPNSTSTSALYAIYISAQTPPAGMPNRIINNVVYNLHNAGTSYGFYGTSSSDYILYHNTFANDQPAVGTGTYRAYGAYLSTNTDVDIRNNIFVASRTGISKTNYSFYITGSFSGTLDHNGHYANGLGSTNYMGYFGSNQATLSDFQSASSTSSNSVEGDPQFANQAAGDLTPQNAAFHNVGAQVNVTTDINGVPRLVAAPELGAFEVPPVINDAGILAIIQPSSPLCSTATDVIVVIGNFGSNTITSVRVDWTLNAIPQTSYLHSQTLLPGETDTVLIGQFAVAAGTSYDLTATTNSPNNTTDGNTANDAQSRNGLRKGLTGTFTINPAGGNYINFNAAVADLTLLGVCGPVVFNVTSSGYIYNERVIIPEIQGASSINTITFNGNGQDLRSIAAQSGDRTTWIFDGADHIIVDSLVMDLSANPSYGVGFQLMNGANHNIIRNCRIITSQTSTSSAFAGIVMSSSLTSGTSAGANGSDNLIEGNTIIGGYYGITLIGNNNGVDCERNIVRNNSIQNYYYSGVYMDDNLESLITANNISRPTRTNSTTAYGIYLTGGGSDSKRVRIEKNQIHHTNDSVNSTTYGIYVTTQTVATSDANEIVNNLIYDLNPATSTCYGIRIVSCAGVNIWHNTLSFADLNATTSTTYGMYISSSSFLDVHNNIVSMQRSGTGTQYCMYLSGASSSSMDNNVLFVQAQNGYVGYSSAARLTLSDWQAATGFDANSTDQDPSFANPASTNYMATASAVQNLGLNKGVPDDILGEIRAIPPDPGAYEFQSQNTDAALSAFVSPVSPACQGNATVRVLLNNAGADTLRSVTIGWTVNGTPQTNFAWTGLLGQFDTQTVTIGTVNIGATPTDLVAWTRNPNGTTDQNKLNDTARSMGLTSAMQGTYAIHSGGLGDYVSFNAAVSDLIARGICASVVFNVTSVGLVYPERVVIPNIAGASALRTITFNGNGQTLQHYPTVSAERTAIVLEGASYVTFNNLVVDASGGTYGFGFQLTNSAEYNTIQNCTVNLDLTSTSSNFAGIVQSGSATSATGTGLNGSHNLIANNTINGGYYGVTMIGNTNAIGNFGNTVRGNKINDAYYYGVYVNNADSCSVIGNDISRPVRTNSGFTYYGIYVTGSGTDTRRLMVAKNRIHHSSGQASSNVYGIYVTGQAPGIGLENHFINNAIYALDPVGEDAYGIYTTSCSDLRLYHNTIALLDNGVSIATARGIYTSSASNVQVKNNIVSLTKSGSAKYAIYVTSLGASTDIDHNVWHVTGSGNHVGYYQAARTTMSDWQTATGYDANSVSDDPAFQSVASGNLLPTQPTVQNIGFGGLAAEDILGTARAAVGPDPGAYEVPPTQNDAALTNFSQPVLPSCAGVVAVAVDLLNVGSDTLKSVNINWTIDGAAQAGVTWTGSLAQYASTSVSLGSLNMAPGQVYTLVAWTSQPNGTADDNTGNDTIRLEVAAAMNGVYEIHALGLGDYMTYNAAVQDLKDFGICGPVVFNVTSTGLAFNERVVIPEIKGSSATNTITFNGNGQVLTFATTSAERSPLVLSGVDHIIIDNILVNVATGSYGYGIQVMSLSEHATIRNCNITANPTSTSSSFAGIVVSSSQTSATSTGANANNLLIENNTIEGGYYGITAVGSSTGDGTGIVIRNNQIRNFYTYGIYCSYTDSVLVEDNVIQRPTRTTVSTFYGIYFTQVESGKVHRNRLHAPFGGVPNPVTSTAYGIYLTSSDGDAAAPSEIYNNALYDFSRTNGTIYQMYYSASDWIEVYHNTLSNDDTAATGGTTRMFYLTSSSNIKLRNNVGTMSRGGTGTKDFMYFTSSVANVVSNNNNWRLTSTAGLVDFAYVQPTTYTTFADWQAGGYDPAGTDVNPLYKDVLLGDYTPTNPFLLGFSPNVGIQDDINGKYRSNQTEPGAFEQELADDIGVSAILTPSSGCNLGSSESITIEIRNYGSNTQTGFDVGYRIVGPVNAGPVIENTGALTIAGQASDVFTFTLPADFSSFGSYTLTTWTALTSDMDRSNDTMVVIIQNNQVIVVDAGADKASCNGSTALIGGLPTASGGSGVYTYEWLPNNSLDNNMKANPLATPPIDMMYTVTVVDNNGCSGVDSVMVRRLNQAPPVADAGPDTTVCQYSNFLTTGAPTASGTGPFAYRWEPVVFFADPTADPATATALRPDVLGVRVTDASGCEGSDSFELAVIPALPASVSADDEDLCFGQTTILRASNCVSIKDDFEAGADPTIWASIIGGTTINGCSQISGQYSLSFEGGTTRIAQTHVLNTTYAGRLRFWFRYGGNSLPPCDRPETGEDALLEYTYDGGNSWILIRQYPVNSYLPWTYVDEPLPLEAKGPTVAFRFRQINAEANQDAFRIDDFEVVCRDDLNYSWSTGANDTLDTLKVQPLTTTMYYVSVADSVGCVTTDSIEIRVTNLTSNAGPDKVICDGRPVRLGGTPTAFNGSGSYTYNWTPAATLSDATVSNPFASPTSTRFYTVNVADNVTGCTHFDIVKVTVVLTSNYPVAHGGGHKQICPGDSVRIGAMPVATGGQTPYTFTWTPANTLTAGNIANPRAFPLTKTSYQLVVRDAQGCRDTADVVVDLFPQPIVDAGADRTICFETSTTLGGSPTVNGGKPPYAINWTPAATLNSASHPNPVASPIIVQNYILNVVDANGCEEADQVLVTIHPVITVDAGADHEICFGDTAFLGGSPTGQGGTSTLSYLWTPSTGLSSATVANPSASPTTTTQYVVTVSDQTGCERSDTVVVTVNPLPIVAAGRDTAVCLNEPVILGGLPSATGVNGPFTHVWSPALGLSNALGANPLATPPTTTNYQLFVTDAKGCQASDQVRLRVRPLPTADAGPDLPLCSGVPGLLGGGAPAFGTTGPYTYAWSPAIGLTQTTVGNPQVSATGQVNYTLVVTDAFGCQGTDEAEVTVSELIIDAGQDAFHCPGDQVTIGKPNVIVSGIGPYSYSWSPAPGLSNTQVPNPSAQVQLPTDFVLTTSDARGCTGVDTVRVDVSAAPSANAGQTLSVCLGNTKAIGGNPSATGGLPPYQYSWKPALGLSNATAANPQAGPATATRYTLTVTDANGCTDSDPVQVLVQPNFTVEAGADRQLCPGIATVLGGAPSAVNGTQPYQFSWTPVAGLSNTKQANPTATPPASTRYTLTVSDADGCVQRDSVLVTVWDQPGADAGPDVIICGGVADTLGGLVPGFNGQIPYTYQWAPATGLNNASAGRPRVNTSIPRQYTLTVTDAHGCVATDVVQATPAPKPTVSLTTPAPECRDVPVGIGEFAQNGTAPYSYQWTPAFGLNSATTAKPSATPDQTTTYNVRVTDKNGCQATASVQVTIRPTPVVDAGPDTDLCLGDTMTLGASPTSTGGISPVTYVWQPSQSLVNSAVANPKALPSVTTAYTVTATGANGCSGLDEVNIRVLPKPAAGFVVTATGLQVDIQDVSSGGQTWTYDFGDQSASNQRHPSHTYSAPGTYTICQDVEALNGCIDRWCQQVKLSLTSVATLQGWSYRIAPNPSSGDFYLSVEGLSEPIRYELLDLRGRVVLEGRYAPMTANTVQVLRTTGLASGTYLLRLHSSKEVYSEKLVIQR